METTVKLGLLAFIGMLYAQHKNEQYRFWDDWNKRFVEECKNRGFSTAQSIPALVSNWEKMRKEPPNQLTGTYQGIFRLLDDHKRRKRREILADLLILFGLCLILVWLVSSLL